MPDHLHALVEAKSERSDFEAFMKRFKQITGFTYKKQTGASLWQPGYHERILRSDEASENVARYILENPIRAGLSKELGEYPYAWSDVYDLEGLLTLWEDPAGSR
jgi:REP-associated tyrosine transposase